MKQIIFRWNTLLAAEYVVGTLPRLSRQRYRFYLDRYPELQTAVTTWQNDLTSLSETLPTVEPDNAIWAAIRSKI